jgi:hypothetical protein
VCCSTMPRLKHRQASLTLASLQEICCSSVLLTAPCSTSMSFAECVVDISSLTVYHASRCTCNRFAQEGSHSVPALTERKVGCFRSSASEHGVEECALAHVGHADEPRLKPTALTARVWSATTCSGAGATTVFTSCNGCVCHPMPHSSRCARQSSRQRHQHRARWTCQPAKHSVPAGSSVLSVDVPASQQRSCVHVPMAWP